MVSNDCTKVQNNIPRYAEKPYDTDYLKMPISSYLSRHIRTIYTRVYLRRIIYIERDIHNEIKMENKKIQWIERTSTRDSSQHLRSYEMLRHSRKHNKMHSRIRYTCVFLCVSLAVSIVKNLTIRTLRTFMRAAFWTTTLCVCPRYTISASCHYITEKNTGKMIVGGHRQTCHRVFEFLTGAKRERFSRDVFSPDRIKRAYSAAAYCNIE